MGSLYDKFCIERDRIKDIDIIIDIMRSRNDKEFYHILIAAFTLRIDDLSECLNQKISNRAAIEKRIEYLSLMKMKLEKLHDILAFL